MDGFSTRAIRATSRPPRVDQRPTSVPIYQAVTFSAETTDELADVTSRRLPGYSYGRIANPTADALGSAVAELEGAEAGYAVASGMAAIHLALLALLRAGDRVVCTRAVYGSTRALLGGTLGRLGITTAFVDPTNEQAVEAVLAEAPTRVLYLETISNPTLVVADIAALAEIGHRHGARVVVDNTFASPYLCRPLELGADLVVESATKYLSGHSDVLAGVVAGDRETIDAVREAQVQTGATIAPFAAFLVLRGIATLAVRLDRQAASAAALAAWLATERGVARVLYPGLPSHPDHAVAARQLASGGGMLAVELEGGAPAGRAFIDALRIPERTASLGSVHTIVVHPPSTTHRQLDTAQLLEGGIAPGLLRVSVGLEDLDDLRADFAAGLAAARAATEPPMAR
ncbi:MAG: aminotransferase class I/II-fold pyridoxal phosphate-dependent enzyme [Chloroflexi bacterium]|jgi:cystathionine beta-lyase/cystathionine gamma-synthase|nr:aminotransferase class I/II-fold pyridoxal phosphate-dependent enzyme [Chloroflexota bacterium]